MSAVIQLRRPQGEPMAQIYAALLQVSPRSVATAAPPRGDGIRFIR